MTLAVSFAVDWKEGCYSKYVVYVLFSEETLLKLVNFTRSAGSRLLFDLNLQLRFGRQWNPGNFIDLLQYCTSENICDIDWELGNGLCSHSFYT